LACAITISGARNLGLEIFKNILSRSQHRRNRAYEDQKKPVWRVKSINSSESKKIIADGKFDLIVNARTRAIFKPGILEMPSRGCINIHHGLLPEQRGVLCDLWALSEGRPAGFSIHFMNEKIDSGPILSRTQVSDGSDRDFLAYLRKSAARERQELEDVLRKFARGDAMNAIPNDTSPDVVFRKNPNWQEIRQMKKTGMRI
jgi:methionyl-tRNA formyltransferase